MSFEQPEIIPVDGHKWWKPSYELTEDYRPRWTNSKGERIGIDIWAEFRLDGSSEWLVSVVFAFMPAIVPWVFGIRADGPQRAAAVVHDYLYGTRELSRKEADWAFKELCYAGGMPRWRVLPRYWVLRLVGWLWWL